MVESNSELLELNYLSPLLKSFPAARVAFDVGAHKGCITRALAEMGFHVYSIEPHPQTTECLAESVSDLIQAGSVELIESAISDQDGVATMFEASIDTLNTLEVEWTKTAFPEYFDGRAIEVPTRTLSGLFTELGIRHVDFLKIDTEGHEPSVLKGLFNQQSPRVFPAIVMFECNKRFSEKAIECLDMLGSNGYELFDLFVKEGTSLLAVARFVDRHLPAEWQRHGEKYYYGNIIAYHSMLLSHATLPNINAFFRQTLVEQTQNLLELERKTYHSRSRFNSVQARMRRFTRRNLDRIASTTNRIGTKFFSSQHEKRVAQWRSVQGDKTLRLEYDLSEASIVFDVGGYEGQWASDIAAMYCCTVHIFEPVDEFAARIRKRFERNPKVHVHPFGLADRSRVEKIAVDRDASSIFRAVTNMQDVQMVSARDFISEHRIERIDLMKINVEGEEYDLLEHLLDCGLVKRIVNIQVQFHDFVPHAEERMLKIQERLAETHTLTYQYSFVWENWRLLPDDQDQRQTDSQIIER